MCREYAIGVGVGAWKVLFTFTMFCCLLLLRACCVLLASHPPPRAEVALLALGPAFMSDFVFLAFACFPHSPFFGLFALASV